MVRTLSFLKTVASNDLPFDSDKLCEELQEYKEEKTKKPKDVFIRQYYEPGQECEFDWGEVKLRIGGKPVTFTMAVFALCHSEGRPLRHVGNAHRKV